MSADTVILGIVALGALLLAGGAMRLVVLERRAMLEYLEKRDRANAEERHTLTSRIQAPALVPPPSVRPGRTDREPRDAREFARIGTVTGGKPDAG